METRLITPADEPSLTEVLGFFWRLRLSILAGILCGALVSLGYFLLAPRIYEAEVVIVPTKQSEVGGNLSGLVGQLGGIGSMLGISLPSNGSEQEWLATLRSRSFAGSFLDKEHRLPSLYPNKWDPRRKEWRVAPDDVPTLRDAVTRFDSKVRFVEEDRRTGLVRVRLQLADRESVAPLTNRFVAEANEVIRQRTMRDAENALKYLRDQAARAPEVEVQNAIY
jgi:hypothetical protein